ncbi:KilA-N domain-containing protein [Aeromonas enteropelogenes]|uniref:KilA-N domain-containing protein n=1 Tax=Aeromonas enteropelogenes TaxID=29489 RepID=UPI001CBD6268|nr:KilA-N domain-containing protein [Aeromonas enteropelogenes]UAK71687.1 KilA-N domain-containing protein [Aeromonas enteropelogenes]
MNMLSNNLDTTTIHNTDTGQLLDIVIGSERFSPESTGLWNLNEIHKRLNLPESKEPSQWRTKVSRELSETANLQVGEFKDGNLNRKASFATELGTIAYAMWVSTEFYLMVAQAFLTLRTIAVVTARANINAAIAIDRKAESFGLTITEALRAAGVNSKVTAQKVNRALCKRGHITYRDLAQTKPLSLKTDWAKTHLKLNTHDGLQTKGGHSVNAQVRFTKAGFEWLKDNRTVFTEMVLKDSRY